MLLYLVRHGQSTYNAQGRIQGQSDSSLSALGQKQALAVARAMAGLPIEALYASPLRRAFQTAEPLSEALGLAIRTDAQLKEVNAGIFEGCLREDVEKEYPNELARWRSGEVDYQLPGGESRRDLIRRGREAFESLFTSGYRQVAVVAHGGLLLAAMKAVLGIASNEPPLAMENASISQLAWLDGDKVELVSFDQIDHLEDVVHPASDP